MGCCSSSQPIEWIDLADTKCRKENVVFNEGLENINGKRRNVASWSPENGLPKAVVFIVHGLGEHALCYYAVAHALVEHGYLVLAMDHVSHGKSDGGARGLITDHRDLPADLAAFVNAKRSEHLALPAFLLAHSMGTLATIPALRNIEGLTAIVLSGAALVAGPAAASPFGVRCLYPLSRTSFARCFTGVNAAISPTAPAAPLDTNAITSDPDILDEIRSDPRRGKPYVMNKTGKELLSLINICKTEVPHITLPFLCVHGSDDTIALKEGSEFIFKNAGTELAQRKLHVFPGLKHEVFREVPPYCTESINMVVEFFDSFVSASQI